MLLCSTGTDGIATGNTGLGFYLRDMIDRRRFFIAGWLAGKGVTMAADRRGKFRFNRRVEEPRRRIMSAQAKENMLAILIRNREAFFRVKDKLTVVRMQHWSAAYTALWKIVCAYYNKHQTMIPRDILLLECQALIDENTGEITGGEIDVVDAFIQFAFDPHSFDCDDITTSVPHRDWAVRSVVRFMQEGTASRVMDRVTTASGTINENLPLVLQQFHAESNEIEAINRPRVGLVFPDNWDTKHRHKLFKTNVATLDFFIDGQRAGEVIGVLGPSGTCKTTLAVQAVVRAAEQCAALAVTGGIHNGRKPVVFYITYETDRQEFGERCIACHAGITRNTLIAMASLQSLPGPKDPIPKEDMDRYAKQIQAGAYLSQRQRVVMATKLINEYCVFIDFSAMDPESPMMEGFGTGGIPEIDSFIAAETSERPLWPYVVWLDHISGMIDMMEDGPRMDDNTQMHRVIAKAPGQARRMIAKKYECPVWLIHQLSGLANTKRPGARMDHSEAEGSKLFGKYCDFSICISKPDNRQYAVFEATKTRRTERRNSAVVWVEGAYNQLHDKSGVYTVDPVRRTILTKKEMAGAPSVGTQQAIAQQQIAVNSSLSEKFL